MENVIFYFTGTGNNLAAARQIAEEIGDTELISIADAVKKGTLDLPYTRVGLVFPTYFTCVPPIVRRFIDHLNVQNVPYLFAVVSFAGVYGMTLAECEQAIAERDGTLHAGFSVREPGNYINKYDASPSGLQRLIYKRAKKKLHKIATAVQAKTTTPIPKGSWLLRQMEAKDREIIAGFGKMAADFHANANCTGCGTCARICPSDNIEITGGKPSWRNACEQCMACIQWCPQKAINYKDITAKRTRYHHPDVTCEDMMPSAVE
ncbi:MAG: EFR1 family ferrodoxin [Ethanoligenens sp.]